MAVVVVRDAGAEGPESEGEDHEAPTAEESESASASTARRDRNVELVRLHEIEVFAEQFPRTMAAFACSYMLVSLTTVALLIWLAVSFAADFHKDCDVPLKLWAIGDFALEIYHSIHGAVLHCCCTSDQQTSTLMTSLPLYARLHLCFITAVDFVWLCMGVVWVHMPGTCSETAPQLHLSVRVCTLLAVIFSFIICINGFGIQHIMSGMMRNGILRTKRAAPEGTMAKLRVVKYDASLDLFCDNTECCICLASFGPRQEIRATRCGHAFHTRCLGNWFNVNRTCPLCRLDLVAGNTDAFEVPIGRPTDVASAPSSTSTAAAAAIVPQEGGGAANLASDEWQDGAATTATTVTAPCAVDSRGSSAMSSAVASPV